MAKPKISIITPSYNQGQFLEQTIDSVLSQGYPNLEYFVMDGGSTDNSPEIIKKYAKHLAGWVSEKDHGQSHAINKGMKQCTGEIFNWINSDDYYQPNAFSYIADAFENPEISMATFRANVFGLQSRTSRGTDIFPGNLPKALAYSRIDQPETFFRMSAVRAMGPLNESLHYCMDKEWLMRYFLLFGNENCINRDEIILNFRYHEDSKSVSKQIEFEKEADKIYHALALQFDLSQKAETIRTINKSSNWPIDGSIQFPEGNDQTDSNLFEKIMDYYGFKRFIEKYELLDFENAVFLYDRINISSLDSKDRAIIKKLFIRLKLIPKPILKMIRRLIR